MADIDKLAADLLAAIAAEDEAAGQQVAIAIGLTVIKDLHRIADAVEAIKDMMAVKAPGSAAA